MNKNIIQGCFIVIAFVYYLLIIIGVISSNNIIDAIMWVGFCINFYTLIRGKKRWYNEVLDLPAIIPLFLITPYSSDLADFIRFVVLICMIFDYFVDTIEEYILHRPLVFVTSVFAITLVIGMLGFHRFEDLSWQDSIWLAFISATTVGYGDFFAVTIFGRITTVFVVLSGAIFFSSVLLAVVIEIIQEYRERKLRLIENNKANEYENREYVMLLFDEFQAGELTTNELREKVLIELAKKDNQIN